MTQSAIANREVATAHGGDAAARPGAAPTPGLGRAWPAWLHCPYCGSPFEPPANTADFEILRCACYQYPVVAGIPILQQVDGLDRVTRLIEGGEPKQALLQALNVFRVRWAHRSRWHQLQYHLNCRRLVADTTLTFAEAAQRLRKPRSFADYLIHRFANPSFLAAIAPLLALGQLRSPQPVGSAAGAHGASKAQTQGRNAGTSTLSLQPSASSEPGASPWVLDLACGAGHSSFLMRYLHPGLTVVSADQDFVSLYLARRFLAPEAISVCWDVEVPSPFPEAAFDAVFCLDAFHYFRSKRAIAAELRRVLKPDAWWLFPHLHNRLQPNFIAGTPLPPEQYLECFGFADGRLLDETAILHALSRRRAVDWGASVPVTPLCQSPTLTFVRGGADLGRACEEFPAAFIRQREKLRVNPIYRRRRRGDDLELELTWPNELMRNECRGAEAVLPLSLRLNRAEARPLRDSGFTWDENRLANLVASFVLVPLPARYHES